MTLGKLLSHLRHFYATHGRTPDAQVRQRVRTQAMRAFIVGEGSERPWGSLVATFDVVVDRLWEHKLIASVLPTLFVVVGFSGFFLIQDDHANAGKIQARFGPVEIIRDDETILVKDEATLRVGDWVRVGNNAEAEVLLPNKLRSIAKTRTRFRVTDLHALFLQSGELDSTVMSKGEIATDRGFVVSEPGAGFHVQVSETGEMLVKPQKNTVYVFDLKDGQLALSPGEEISLKSDTRLVDTADIPQDIRLSTVQIESIESKLIIARTKLMTSIENRLQRRNRLALRDMKGAERTFLSIAQVPMTTRELEIAKRRNMDTVTRDQVYPLVVNKVANQSLLDEIKAIEALFDIIEQNKDQIRFGYAPTGVRSFDRYVLLSKLLPFGTDAQAQDAQYLLQRYVVNFLRKVQNEELRVDQVAILHEEVAKLPDTDLAREFLLEAKDLFAPGLADILEKKIRYAF